MGTGPKISEQVAALTKRLTWEDLPPKAQKKTKTLVMDLMGSIIGSKKLESSRIAREIALEMGGPEESYVVGSGRKVAAPNAAFANAIQSYGFDFADDHNESNAHPSVATIPGSLALGQKLHASGKDVLVAIALGNEIVCRFGAAFLGKTYYQGFHPTSTCGMFGTAISGAKLLNLDEQKIVWSLGIAGSMTSGLMAWNTEGSFTKRLQAGHPSMCGLLAAMMAQKGFNGPSEIIEGRDGFMQAYSYQREYDTRFITEGLGTEWTFADSSIKFYPCCRYSGGHLDACLDIVAKYHPDPRQIKHIHIRSSDYTIRLLTLPLVRKLKPITVVDAQFSMPWQAAMALIDGKIDVDTFTDANLSNELALAMIPKIDWVIDEEFERRYPAFYSCAVTVTMNDGSEYTSVIDNPKGDYRNPMTDEEIEAKFVKLARREIADEGRIQKIVACIKSLDTLADINDLFSLLN
jgi:2-methylcitrate dehydratase PrpD